MNLLQYLALNHTRKAVNITTNTATFSNSSMATAPTGCPANSITQFTFYVNGQYIVPISAITSFNQVGSDLVLTVNTTILGFEFDIHDEIVGVGKFN